MKLIIEIPDTAYEAYKEWHKQGVSNVEQSLIANGIPYEEQLALNNITESDKQKLIETIRKSRLKVIDTSDGCKWIPVTYRPMTEEEEKEFCVKWDIKEGSLEEWEKRVFTCHLPEDGQEILISVGKYVHEDICSWDEECCGLENNGDWDGVDAWMPKPEPYKKGGEKE